MLNNHNYISTVDHGSMINPVASRKCMGQRPLSFASFWSGLKIMAMMINGVE